MTPLTRTSVSHYVLSNSVAEKYKVQLTQTHRAAQTWKKLLVARQGTKLLIFYGNPKSLPFSQRPAIGTFSKPDHTTHFLTYFNTLPFFYSSFSIQVSNENFVCISHTSLTSRYKFPVQKSSFIWGLQIMDLLIIRLHEADAVSINNKITSVLLSYS